MKTTTTAKMTAFTIVWHEGTGEFDNMTFRNWQGAQFAFDRIYRHHMEDGGQGYTKVKVNVKWDNGAEITDRMDVSDATGDYCPKRETVGQYLARQNSVMYASNLSQGDRAALSFEDQPAEAPKARKTAKKQPKPALKLTFEDVITMQAKTYLLN